MKKQTDLQKVKEVATNMVYLPYRPSKIIPSIIFHPFHDYIYQVLRFNMKTDEGYIYYINNDLEIMQEQFIRLIMESENLLDLDKLITLPYKFCFLKEIEQYITVEDLGNYIRRNWRPHVGSMREYPKISKATILRWFKQSHPEDLMDKADRKVYTKLPDAGEVEIFRGIRGYNPKQVESLSWTLYKEIAYEFARKFGEGQVYTAKIKKSDILAYYKKGGQEEVIVNYKKLQDVQLINTI